MQKEVWEKAWASSEALASPCVTFVTPPNRELAHRLTQTHTHITVTNKVLLLHTPNCGPIQRNTWFLHCVQIIKTITYYTFHVMWDELDNLEWSKSMDRTDWPKEDGFYKLIITQMVLIIPPIEKIQNWMKALQCLLWLWGKTILKFTE